MRLLIANAWGERLGGAENHLWTLLRHLDTNRVEPVVVFLAPGSFHDEVAALGIRTELLPTRRVRHGGRFVPTVRALRSLLQRERPDVTLGWGPKPQLYLGPATATIGRAQRNVWMLPEVPGHPVHRIAARLPAAAVMCPSNFLRERLAAVAPSRSAFVVHSGIELRPVSPGAERRALQERLGIPPERTIVGMVARLAPVKGQDRLLRAAAAARERGLDLHVLLVGGDAHGLAPHYEQKLRAIVTELGLDERVTFTGHRPDPYAELSLFDVFVSAASEDGFPMAPLEAMALGIPVVAVNAGGPSEMIEHGRSGYLVESEDPQELAAALESVTGDEELRGTLTEGGRARILDRFTADRMAAELTDRLESIVEPASEPEAAQPPSAVPESQRRGELGQVVRNALSAYGTRAVMAAAVLILTPFLYRQLGAAGFGTWAVVYVISNIFTLIETGFARGISQVIARQLGERDREAVSETVGTSVVLLGMLGVLAAAVSIAVGVFLPGLAANSVEHAFTVGMIVLGIERLIYFPLSAYAAALVGYQRYDLFNFGNVVNTAAYTIGAIAAVEAGGDVLAVIVVFSAAHLLMGVVNVISMRRTDVELALRPRLGHADTRRGLTRFSSYVLLAESMTFIGQRMDTLVIAAIRGAAAAGPYAAVLKLQTGLQSLTLPVVYQLMPMVSDLWARGRGSEVGRRFGLATRIVLQVTLPPAAALALFSQDTIHLWLGKDTPEVAESILVILMFVQIIMLTAAPAEQVLVGIGRVRAVGLLTLVEGVSNLAVSVVLVYLYGAIGAAIGTLVTSGVISPLKVPLACRAVGVSTISFFQRTVVIAVASSLPALAAMTLVRVLVSPGPGRLAFGLLVGAALTIAVGAWQIGPNRARETLRSLGAARASEGLAAAGSSEL